MIFVGKESQKVEHRIPKEGPLKILGDMPDILSSLIQQLDEIKSQSSFPCENGIILSAGEPEIQETYEDFFDIYFGVTISDEDTKKWT